MRFVVSGDALKALCVNRWFTRCASGILSPRLASIFRSKLAGSFSTGTFRRFVSTDKLLSTFGRSNAFGLIRYFSRLGFFRRWGGPGSWWWRWGPGSRGSRSRRSMKDGIGIKIFHYGDCGKHLLVFVFFVSLLGGG
jgi:hypothetical protein